MFLQNKITDTLTKDINTAGNSDFVKAGVQCFD
jgi:hypothetical protein